MCGRFALGIPSARLMEFFNLSDMGDRDDYFRYNIAPTDIVPGIVRSEEAVDRRLTWFRWGLVPAWAKDPKIGSRLINARAETLAGKPSFRQAFQKRRCLIPAQGFYEWDHRGETRRPWFFRRRDGNPMAFAGLWEHWRHGTDEIVSCTIVTTTANDTMAPLHNRMPVILDIGSWNDWLDPAATVCNLTPLLVPASDETLDRYPVSPAVNNPRYEGADCVVPIPGQF